MIASFVAVAILSYFLVRPFADTALQKAVLNCLGLPILIAIFTPAWRGEPAAAMLFYLALTLPIFFVIGWLGHYAEGYWRRADS